MAGFGTFRAHSSLLRGGGGGFSVVPVVRKRGEIDIRVQAELGGGRRKVWFVLAGLLAPCCLTIASEGRETWAAGSLRGFGVGFVGRELSGSGDGVRERQLTVTFQEFIAPLREGLRWSAVRRSGAGLL